MAAAGAQASAVQAAARTHSSRRAGHSAKAPQQARIAAICVQLRYTERGAKARKPCPDRTAARTHSRRNGSALFQPHNPPQLRSMPRARAPCPPLFQPHNLPSRLRSGAKGAAIVPLSPETQAFSRAGSLCPPLFQHVEQLVLRFQPKGYGAVLGHVRRHPLGIVPRHADVTTAERARGKRDHSARALTRAITATAEPARWRSSSGSTLSSSAGVEALFGDRARAEQVGAPRRRRHAGGFRKVVDDAHRLPGDVQPDGADAARRQVDGIQPARQIQHRRRRAPRGKRGSPKSASVRRKAAGARAWTRGRRASPPDRRRRGPPPSAPWRGGSALPPPASEMPP